MALGPAAASPRSAGAATRVCAAARRATAAVGAAATARRTPPTESLRGHRDDGVALHVEIDEPDSSRPAPAPSARPTVVFTHGYCPQHAVLGPPAPGAERLRLRVVRWDQRGHGRSGAAPRAAPSTSSAATSPRHRGDRRGAGGARRALDGRHDLMSLAEQHPDVVRDRVVGPRCVATSAGGAEMTELGLGTTVGRVHRLVRARGPHPAARHAGAVVGAAPVGRDLEDLIDRALRFASPVAPPRPLRAT